METLAAEVYRVRSAADGVAGLELDCTETFDLILLDVMMPGLDGFAVCHERDLAVPDLLGLGLAAIDFRRCVLTRAGQEDSLSDRETGILRLLAAQPGEAVSREKFLVVVWGCHAYPSTRTIDNFITALRAKLETDPANPSHFSLSAAPATAWIFRSPAISFCQAPLR